jgi:hypothetical protein|eukprot:COSAG03_NODE_1223_length_4527_cov_1.524164_4_plen_62_part_00
MVGARHGAVVSVGFSSVGLEHTVQLTGTAVDGQVKVVIQNLDASEVDLPLGDLKLVLLDLA